MDHPRRRPQIVERDVWLTALPDELDGLRIAHLSDLHVGHLFTPAKLTGVIEACGELGADLIAITGDFVDFSLNVLDSVLSAIGRLRAPLGVHLVPGNHDYLDDPPALLRRFEEAGLPMLLNRHIRLDCRGKSIAVGGIDWAGTTPKLAAMVRHAMATDDHQPHTKPDLRLLLAHHPHAFDEAHRQGVDLTLSGHTHGGQLMLTKGRNGKRPIGLGNLAFRYPAGLYRRGESRLYVTTGVGSWFPWRINAPAEIACLTLHSGQQPDLPVEPITT
jgi:predicted MPP superfamily phosphohydrolase